MDFALAALVADIGGTNARFALAASDDRGRPVLTSVREFAVAQFASPAQAALHYLAQIEAPRPRRSVIAVATAITGDDIKVTNNPWSFSITALQCELGLDRIQVINDVSAIAMAIPHLAEAELEPIGAPAPPASSQGLPAVAPGAKAGSDRHYAVLGAGTGLGVCRLLLRKGRPVVLDSEGGHVAFAPGDDYEIAILQCLMKRHARVSVERLISGPGLQNLYAAVCAVEGTAQITNTPEGITAGAAAGSDAACRRAVELFCSILGSFAGDAALMYGAWDGVYLGGGLTATLLPWIGRGQFRRRFESKGRFCSLMQTIPTFAITHAQAGLLGAGACAADGQA
jgi:glucokinase